MEYALCQQDRTSALIAQPPLCGRINSQWFSAAHWGNRAQPVASGGRGGSWFVSSEEGDWVLRHYRRGGFAVKLSSEHYMFTGRQRVRCIAEFQLLIELGQRGLPVPVPVAAYWRRAGLVYRAAIIVQRIPGATTLATSPNRFAPHLWWQIGAIIRRFHRAGLDHVDLNIHNILLVGSEVYLIDFDRCRLRDAEAGSAWQSANLQRLQRSVHKHLPDIEAGQRQQLWQQLLLGYGHRSG